MLMETDYTAYDALELMARGISDDQACGHCEGDCKACLTEATEVLFLVSAEAWDEGYEAGCQSLYGTATPSGVPCDPEPNPYRIEEANA